MADRKQTGWRLEACLRGAELPWGRRASGYLFKTQLYFVTELIQPIPSKKREGVTRIENEFGAAAKLLMGLRRFMSVRGIPRRSGRVLARRSKGSWWSRISNQGGLGRFTAGPLAKVLR